MKKINKTYLMIVIIIATMFLFATGYSAWIIINQKDNNAKPVYNYEQIVYEAFKDQAKDYNKSKQGPNARTNIDSDEFTFEHRLHNTDDAYEEGLPKDSGVYDIKIYVDSKLEPVVVQFTINKIVPVKYQEGYLYNTFVGAVFDISKSYNLDSEYTGHIEVEYYDLNDNKIDGTPTEANDYKAIVSFSESGNFKAHKIEVDVSLEPVNNVDPDLIEINIINSYEYTGKEIELNKNDLEVYVSGTKLSSDNFKIIGYSNNVNAGSSATVTIDLENGYDGTKTSTFTISKMTLTPLTLEVSYDSNNRIFSQIVTNQILNNTYDTNNNITSGLVLVDSKGNKHAANGLVNVVNMHNGYYGYGSLGSSSIYETTTNVVGSTYIVKLIITNTNYVLSSDTFVLKYKTVMIDSDTSNLYTIEDAFEKATSKIWFKGDATGTESYVHTAFTSLFDLYDNTTEYTLDVKLIVPYKDSVVTSLSDNRETSGSGTTGNVYSAFSIPKNLTITISGSGGIAVAAAVGHGQTSDVKRTDLYTTAAKNRGVLINNGTIHVQKGQIYVYGYIKGTGNIILESGTTMQESMTLYDWPGGTATSGMYKSVFPINCWSFRNNICTTIIKSGALYKGWVNVGVSSTNVDIGCDLIGNTSSDTCLFKPINSSVNGQIIKSILADNDELANLNQITSYNQLRNINVKDSIRIDKGQYTDSTLSMSKTVMIFITVELSTDLTKPLPISYMDVVIGTGAELELSSSDYLFLPGTKGVVEPGAKLTIGDGVDLTFVSYENFYENEIYVKYSTGWFNDQDAYLEVNGELLVLGNIGGKFESTNSGAVINIKNGYNTSTYKSMNSTESPYYKTVSNYQSIGLINGTEYKSFEPGHNYLFNGTYWFKDKLTISYVTNGANEDIPTLNINLTANGYVLDSLPVVTKTGYEFIGWYLDESFEELANNVCIYDSVTLYAKWNICEYTITFDSDGGTEISDITALYGTEILEPDTPVKEGYIFNGWYDNKGTAFSFPLFMPEGGLDLTAHWLAESAQTYTVSFDTNGGTTIDSITVEEGTLVNPESLITYKNGYYVNGWTLDGNVYDFAQPIMNDITLVVVWEPEIYTVTFKVNGEIVGTDTYTILDNSVTEPTIPDKLGYNGTWGDYTLTTGNVDINASYIPIKYTIKYNLDDGTNNPDNPPTYTIEDEVVFKNPTKSGHDFTGWTKDGKEIKQINVGTTGDITITANWKKQSSGGCLAEGTLVTMADGTKKKVDDIVQGDMIIVFNHETGKYEAAAVLFNDTESLANYVVINLEFSNGSTVKVVDEHGFFDLDLMEYVYIDEFNYMNYVGHRFVASTYINGEIIQTEVTLDNAYLTNEYIRIYSPTTYYHLNLVVEDILSMPGGISGLFNIFEYDENLQYNKELMEKDIEEYGLFTYDDFKDLVSYDIYCAFPAAYFKVAIGKGILTWEALEYYIARYTPLV